MTCQSWREAIVEIARGREVGAGTPAAVETHVAACDACAALLAREQHVTISLKALAAASSGEIPSEELRRRLVAAFRAGQQAPQPARHWRWRQWAAAAATLAAVVVWGLQDDRRYSPRIPDQSVAGPPQQPAAASPAPREAAPVPDRGTESESSSRPARTALRKPPRRAAAAPRAVNPEGFVPLPAAAGLPDFESGAIVRMELPVTMLPAYGVDLGQQLVREQDVSVEADLLVGQDGQPRAIRLVSPGSSR
jgi:hypothetical protein